MTHTDIISPDNALHLPGLLAERAKRSPEALACREFNAQSEQWQDVTWQQVANIVDHRRAVLAKEQFDPGDRVAIMLKNCCEWVYFDMAALSLGLVTVPLYPNDRPDNVAYILANSGAKLLLLEDLAEQAELAQHNALKELDRIITIVASPPIAHLPQCLSLEAWLSEVDAAATVASPPTLKPHDLASIVYTSGTTGPAKGVMLSHHNMLWNAWSGLQSITIYPDDRFLSFLPLSHTLERSIGYYLAIMAGAAIIYARSIPQLAEDLVTQRPTVLISVPRIYERVFNKIHDQLQQKSALAQKLFQAAVDIGWRHFEHQQKRLAWHPILLLHPILHYLVGQKIQNKLGGELRVAICGGAPLAAHIAKMFIALGIPIYQGYGLTETSPVISVNTPSHNLPKSIGIPLQDVTVRFSPEGELQVTSPGVMLGYWQNEAATADTIHKDGWLNTGDLGYQDESGFLHITGRLKDVLIMSNGEKISPTDIEMAICKDPFIDSAIVIGESKPFLSALLLINEDAWSRLAEAANLTITDPKQLKTHPSIIQLLLSRIQQQLHDFPAYANILQVAVTLEPWTVENNLSTPTLKAKRPQILQHYAADIDALYEGH